jgi:hypothetical protein
MASSHEVTCVSTSGNHYVTHLGGRTPQGRGWRVSMQDAVEGVLHGRWVFFITADGKRQDLQVAIDQSGTKHLKVKDQPDGQSLMRLPNCQGRDEL